MLSSFLFPPALPAITMHQTWISTGSCSTQGPCCLSTWSLQTSCNARDFRPWCQLTTLWKEWVQETTVNVFLLVSIKLNKFFPYFPQPQPGKSPRDAKNYSIYPQSKWVLVIFCAMWCQVPCLLLWIGRWISWRLFFNGKVGGPSRKPGINRICITCISTWIDAVEHMTISLHFSHSLHSLSFRWNLGIGKSQQLRCQSASVCRS